MNAQKIGISQILPIRNNCKLKFEIVSTVLNIDIDAINNKSKNIFNTIV